MVTHRPGRWLLGFAAVITLTTTFAAAVAVETYTATRLETFLAETARTVVRQTAASVAQHALANDKLAMNLLLGELAEDANVVNAEFYGADNRLIAAAGMISVLDGAPGHGTAQRDAVILVEPVSIDNALAGHLRITWSLSAYHEFRARMRTALAASAMVMLLLSLLGAHLLLLRREAGNGRAADTEPGNTESGERSDAIVPATGTAPDADFCAVLVMEPVGLHKLLDQFEAEQINGILRRAYEVVRRSASLYQARHCLIEHNRILILFTGGSDDEPEAFRAVCTGRLILQLLDRMRGERTAKTGPAMHFHGLVHAGMVHLPDHLEGEIRLEELDGQQGAVVRMAGRMLEHVERDELLVSDAALDHATVLEKVRFGEARNARTRESRAPLQLFPVISLAPGYEILQERQGENLLYAAKTY